MRAGTRFPRNLQICFAGCTSFCSCRKRRSPSLQLRKIVRKETKHEPGEHSLVATGEEKNAKPKRKKRFLSKVNRGLTEDQKKTIRTRHLHEQPKQAKRVAAGVAVAILRLCPLTPGSVDIGRWLCPNSPDQPKLLDLTLKQTSRRWRSILPFVFRRHSAYFGLLIILSAGCAWLTRPRGASMWSWLHLFRNHLLLSPKSVMIDCETPPLRLWEIEYPDKFLDLLLPRLGC